MNSVEFLNLDCDSLDISRKDSERISETLSQEGVFSGGGYDDFHDAGENQLKTLLYFGLQDSSRVLDIGCGCLRGGRWVIPFLDRDCYFGIEPNKHMLDAGKRIVIDEETISEKSPKFDTNSEFDFGVFDAIFDFVIARSVWTHASKDQIEKMLDQFVLYSNEHSKFLTSYLKPRIPIIDDYRGKRWVGKSHESDQPGIARHSLRWIRQVCRNRNLRVTRIDDPEVNYKAQVWLKVERLRL